MRVLALTFGDADQASSKYRVYQYIEPLRRQGIEMVPRLATEFADWPQLADYDVVLIQKKLFSTDKVRRIRRLARYLIYDVDDAIWEPHGQRHSWITNLRTRMRLKAIVAAADATLTSNDVLAEHLRQHSKNVNVLPMALDETVWRLRAERAQSPCIGWAGHPVNLPYLEAIEPALMALQEKYPDVSLRILCGRAPAFKQLHCEHVPFDPKTEVDVIGSFDIGLLPLPSGRFAEGKSPIKGLQYMACGLATILSPIGASGSLFQDGVTGLFASGIAEWQHALEKLIANLGLRNRIGSRARQVFEARFALRRQASVFAEHLRHGRPGVKPH